jgi:ornithine carbamoyltransferase
VARDFLSIDDVTPQELGHLLELAAKAKQSPGDHATRLAGRAVALIFEKPSTRTRVSFEVAVTQTGGHPVVLSSSELQLGRGETIEDTGRVLSRYVDCIVLRTFGQERLEHLASAATVPVVNALSDYEHPCQILADLLTIVEHRGDPAGLRVATPPGFEPIPQVVNRAAELAREAGGAVEVTSDPKAAAEGADVLYTDVWASMGQEEEHTERVLVFTPYRLDAAAVDRAADDVIVLHCLPAHRGEEITDEVIDGPHSVVWDQAENRLHTQGALLLWLLGAE